MRRMSFFYSVLATISPEIVIEEYIKDLELKSTDNHDCNQILRPYNLIRYFLYTILDSPLIHKKVIFTNHSSKESTLLCDGRV